MVHNNIELAALQNVLILLRDKVIKVPVKISRLIRSRKSFDNMAVEVLEFRKEYFEFVEKQRKFYKSDNSSRNRIFA